MTEPSFFGYGSLVHLATHAYRDPRPATLPGWRRIWRTTTLRRAAFLSVEPDFDCRIDGIVAQVPDADWTALDQREAAYTRVDISETIGVPECAVYRVSTTVLAKPGGEAPILRSYLDTVAQGFFDIYGEEGLARFFATTTGWGPIDDDRAEPVYSRVQPVADNVTERIDGHLAALDGAAQGPG
ncbi:gamma-glutamylcyclotransferase [Salipiger sp. IMCC34102]|uniref:gamma-glutamylcyclotransferase family protein n=1 Tax=Salipiger sp. IMCC34102 TaxID=2510647 RepID=UPI00101C388B|nr:gamma-glutamylcyclotransferase family protein [Salipiger sp. IMCC34102]RYH02152.1 gamma-glutamylcyclotransferase [Salipiger sp. IMCC34102]